MQSDNNRRGIEVRSEDAVTAECDNAEADGDRGVEGNDCDGGGEDAEDRGSTATTVSGVTNSAASGFGEGGVATPRSPVASELSELALFAIVEVG